MVVPATVVDSNTMTCRTPKLATNDYEIHVSLNGKTFHQVMIATAKVWAQTQGPAGVKASNLSKQGGYLSRKKRVADVVGDAADGAPLVRSRAGCVGPLLSSYSPHSVPPPVSLPCPSPPPPLTVGESPPQDVREPIPRRQQQPLGDLSLTDRVWQCRAPATRPQRRELGLAGQFKPERVGARAQFKLSAPTQQFRPGFFTPPWWQWLQTGPVAKRVESNERQ